MSHVSFKIFSRQWDGLPMAYFLTLDFVVLEVWFSGHGKVLEIQLHYCKNHAKNYFKYDEAEYEPKAK